MSVLVRFILCFRSWSPFGRTGRIIIPGTISLRTRPDLAGPLPEFLSFIGRKRTRDVCRESCVTLPREITKHHQRLTDVCVRLCPSRRKIDAVETGENVVPLQKMKVPKVKEMGKKIITKARGVNQRGETRRKFSASDRHFPIAMNTVRLRQNQTWRAL